MSNLRPFVIDYFMFCRGRDSGGNMIRPGRNEDIRILKKDID